MVNNIGNIISVLSELSSSNDEINYETNDHDLVCNILINTCRQYLSRNDIKTHYLSLIDLSKKRKIITERLIYLFEKQNIQGEFLDLSKKKIMIEKEIISISERINEEFLDKI